MIAVVKYSVGAYSGTVHVSCLPDDETSTVIAIARRVVTRRAGGTLPFGAETWREVSRSESLSDPDDEE